VTDEDAEGTGGARTEADAKYAPVARRGRPSKRHLKREALLEGATALFNARGIAGVSLGDIAEHLGLSRPTVYYYVNDRAELAFQCYLRACERTAEDLAIASDAADGIARVLAFVREERRFESPVELRAQIMKDVGVATRLHRRLSRTKNATHMA